MVEKCLKYRNKFSLKKPCEKNVFENDDYGRKWEYCQEHGCVICLGITRSHRVIKEAIPGSNFWKCNSPKCNENHQRIKSKNTEARTQLFNGVSKIKRLLENNSFGRRDNFLEQFVETLGTIESQAIKDNLVYEKLMSPVNLSYIKGTIDACHELSQEEREILKNVYTNDNIDDIINEKEAAFVGILNERNLKIERNNFIKDRLEKLPDWNLLSGSQRQGYRDEISKSHPSVFDSVLNSVRAKIAEVKSINDNTEREKERERESKIAGCWDKGWVRQSSASEYYRIG
ncbi:MAG: hypothetical protein MRERV_26c019 [Mycoplasmataceae bacterium RV_VA103A]|nr:MAG: hypothetical protein MRERV_26c019 [Mycoplasmataceae bacterium RV_VA103A]